MRWIATVILLAMPLIGRGQLLRRGRGTVAVAAVHETRDAIEEALWDQIGKGQGSLSDHPLALKLAALTMPNSINEALWDKIGKGEGSLSDHPLVRKLAALNTQDSTNEAALRRNFINELRVVVATTDSGTVTLVLLLIVVAMLLALSEARQTRELAEAWRQRQRDEEAFHRFILHHAREALELQQQTGNPGDGRTWQQQPSQ